MREVFLSYSSRDHAKARRLRDLLVAHDVPVWFAPHHIRAAQQWQDEIGEALARCDWFMVLLTPHAVESTWVKRELSYALNERRYDEQIVPLLFKKCEFNTLSWILPQLQFIDFTKDYQKACAQLLKLWNKPLRKRPRKNRSDEHFFLFGGLQSTPLLTKLFFAH